MSISGVVKSRDGPIAAAVVYAYSVDPLLEDQVSSQSTTNEDGQFALRVPKGTLASLVDVGAVADGYVRNLVQNVCIQPGGTKVDFLLERGLSVSGFVHDLNGRPLSGVGILATQDFKMDRSTCFISSAMLDTSELRLAKRDSTYHESGGTTGEGGFFELTGLASGEYILVSRSDSYLWKPERAFAGDNNIRLQAEVPAGVVLEILDAINGEPIARPSVRVQIEGLRPDGTETHPIRRGVGADGRAKILWKPESAYHIVALDVSVSAPGYNGRRDRHEVASDGPIKARVELTRSNPQPLRIQASFENGELPIEDLVIRYEDPDGGYGGTVFAQSLRPGEYTCDLREGQWLLSIRAKSDLGAMPPWTSEVLNCTTAQTVSDVVLPSGLAVNVRSPFTRPWSVKLEAEGFESQRTVEGPVERITGIPPGDWLLRVYSHERKADWTTKIVSAGRGEIDVHVP